MAIGTTRGANLGGAYVTVDAEVGGFGGRLIAKLRKELKEADKEGRARGREIGKELADGILQGFMRRLPGMRRDIELALRAIEARIDVKVDVDRIKDTTVQIGVELDEDKLKKTTERVKNTGRQIQRDATEIAGGVLGRLAIIAAGMSKSAEGMLKKLKTTMGSARGNAITVTAALYAIYAAAVAAVSAIHAIGRELTNILKLGLLLPGLLASVAAVALPMMLVFQGLGDDLKGIFDADPKKAQEALNKLSGSVREFAQELKNAKPWFDDLKKSTREAFFQNITGILTHIVKNFGPAIKSGFNEIADSVGGLFRDIFEKMSTPETLGAITTIFDKVSSILDRAGGPAGNFFAAMRDAAVASMPAIERLSKFIGRIIDEFSNWIGESVDSGEFQDWLDDGLDTLEELYDLIKEVMDTLGVMFDEGNQDGDSFIEEITNMIKSFREFAESEDGKLALDGISLAATIATFALKAIIVVVWAVVSAIADLLGIVKRAIIGIRDLYRVASGRSIGKAAGTAVSTAKEIAMKNIGQFADGGIIEEPTLATFAEDGPEAAIPLTKPSRARQLLRESGLDKLVTSGHAERAVQVQVYIGNEQLDSRVYQVARRATNASVASARMSGLGGVNPQ